VTERQLPSRVSVARDLVSSEVGPEMVILHLTKGVYYSLNGTGARIWALLVQSAAPAEIRDALAREYQVEADICAADLCAFFHELARGDLIDVIP